MPDPITKTPVIRQPWLRVLLFVCAFCLIGGLIGIPAVLAITGTPLKDFENDPLHTLTGLMTGDYLWLMITLELVISVVTVVIFRWWIDRRSWMSLGWTFGDFTGEALTGLFLGPALLGLVAVGVWLSGHWEWTDISWDPSALFLSFGWMLLIAFSEELVFRGYILGNLLESFPNKWIALAITSLLFALYHSFSPGIHTLAFVNLFLAGMLLGLNYTFTRNLWFSFLFHVSWNFFQGPILGSRVSGISFPSLLQAEPNGDLFITGGDFGLEGSILNTLFLLAAILVLAWAFERKYNPDSAAAPPTVRA